MAIEEVCGGSYKPCVCIADEPFLPQEFSIEIPDKDADTIHSGMLCLFAQPPISGYRMTDSPSFHTVDKAVEYILSQPDAN